MDTDCSDTSTIMAGAHMVVDELVDETHPSPAWFTFR